MNALAKMNALGIAILGSSLVLAGGAFAHGGGGGGGGMGGGGFAHSAPAPAAPAALRPAAPAAFRPAAPAKEAPAFRPGQMTTAPAFRPREVVETKAASLRPLAQQSVGGHRLRGESGWRGGLGFHGGRWGFRIGDRHHGRTFS